MIAVPLTVHADRRRVEMGLTDDEVEAVALEPETSYPADARRHGPGRTIHRRGRICSVHGTGGVVVTFLWSGSATGYQPWSR